MKKTKSGKTIRGGVPLPVSMDVSSVRLDAFRHVTDAAADRLAGEWLGSGRAAALYQELQRPLPALAAGESAVASFLLAARERPDWLDEKMIRAGRSVFAAHTAPIMGVLGLFSLPFCYAAAPGNKALYLSDKMRKAPGKRLLDTAAFVQAVCGSADPAALTHAINRTRLIHAVARWHLRTHGWNPQWGEPINQEDMAGTNLAFSYLVLLGLQQSGIVLSDLQKEGFLHLWRCIGFSLCLDASLLPTGFSEARELTALIRRRNLQKSAEGIALTHELVQCYQQASGMRDPRTIEAQLAWYLGAEVAGFLGLTVEPETSRRVDFIQQCNRLGRLLDQSLPGIDPFASMRQNLPQPLAR